MMLELLKQLVIRTFYSLMLLVVLISGCKEDVKPTTIPSVITGDISSITSNGATAAGQVVTDGNLPVTERGIVFGISPDPTISDRKVVSGDGIGTFSVTLSGLEPGVPYHVRAYGINAKGIAYGLDRTFNAAATLPAVTTVEGTSIGLTTATAGGNVTSDGGSVVTARGVVFSTFPAPTIAGSKTTDGSGTGTFVSSLSGLVSSTKYFVRAYAVNGVGTAYGNEITITTSSPTAPTVNTLSVTSIANTSAISGGEVIADGGAAVTARGICWATSPNPTVADNKTTDGSGLGTFTSAMSNLIAATTYYVRSYATNSAGTAYGPQLSFTTAALLTDVDGNSYSILTIGNQVWMKENLRVTRYKNGDAIPYYVDNGVWASLTSGSYAYYNHDPALEKIYGKLYNWFAAVDPRGLCPTGWHVPSDAEWATLVATLGGEAVAGGKMKSTGTDLWRTPNTGATNESGFSGLPSAFRHYSGYFANMGDVADWWSSTPRDAGSAREQNVGYIYSSANTYYAEKQDGFAIRCLKD